MVFDPSAFSEGWQQEATRGRQNRLDNLKLWREFNQQNPYASLSDLQEYRDALTGGSTYLGNVLPSNSVLQNLSERNRAAYEQSQLEQTYANMTKRASLFGTMEASIDDALLQSGGKDFVEAYETFRANNPELEQTPELAKRIRAAFNPSRYQSLISKKTMEYLPRAKALLDSTDGQLTTEALQANLGIPSSIATPLLAAAQQDKERADLEWQNSHYNVVMDRAYAFADEGEDPTRAVEEALTAMGKSKLHSSEWAKSLVNAVKKRRERGVEKRKIERDNRLSQESIKLDQIAQQDKALLSLIANNDWERAQSRLEAIADRWLPKDLRDEFDPKELRWMLDNLAGTINFNREVALQNSRFAHIDALEASRTKDTTADAERIIKYFKPGNAKAAQAVQTADGKPNPLIITAVQQLNNTYDLNGPALVMLQGVYRDPNSKTTANSSVQELVQVGHAALQRANVRQRSTHLATDRAAAVQRGLGVDRPMTAREFEDRRVDAVQARQADATKYLNMIKTNVSASPNPTPDVLKRAIEHIKRLVAEVENQTNAFQQETRYYEQTRTTWEKVERTGGAWNDANIRVILDSDKKNLDEFKKIAESEIAAYETQLQKIKSSGGQEQIPANVAASTGTTTPFGRSVDRVVSQLDLHKEIEAYRMRLGQDAGILGRFKEQTDEERDAKGKVKDWIDKMGGSGELAAKLQETFGADAAAEWQKFLADTGGTMRRWNTKMKK